MRDLTEDNDVASPAFTGSFTQQQLALIILTVFEEHEGFKRCLNKLAWVPQVAGRVMVYCCKHTSFSTQLISQPAVSLHTVAST